MDIKSKLIDIQKAPEFFELLMRFESVFSDNKFNIGCINDHKGNIELETRIPINCKPYRVFNEHPSFIENGVKSLLNAGLIRLSFFPYSFPVTLAYKKEDKGRTRFCIDYRKLNDKIIPDWYPMPRIEDIIDSLSGSQFFSVFDTRSGFNVKVRESDIIKTAFVTQNGHYEWLVMPFGLKTAPAIFQRS